MNIFPRPRFDTDNLDMSFSGLKTSVVTYLKKNADFNVSLVSAEIQEAIVDTLIEKACKAIELYKPKSFLLAGGVSANTRLRAKLRQKFHEKNYSIETYIPEPKYSTDNAVMIATCAFYKNSPAPINGITVKPSLSIEE